VNQNHSGGASADRFADKLVAVKLLAGNGEKDRAVPHPPGIIRQTVYPAIQISLRFFNLL
jgi:hypothetical protein